ncbi:hypothetical protein MPLDJ20_100058 [Mesorhizobium plurifarium]|uniref:Uncharacterized protein n=1 Tax=Mesorhizobium plurifarium TaxID=69974 RepID=A0A090F4M0_MESPL|nr:hypothetical protein MPLDJ20_100058 [Mesorhizobium plurifarium]
MRATIEKKANQRRSFTSQFRIHLMATGDDHSRSFNVGAERPVGKSRARFAMTDKQDELYGHHTIKET